MKELRVLVHDDGACNVGWIEDGVEVGRLEGPATEAEIRGAMQNALDKKAMRPDGYAQGARKWREPRLVPALREGVKVERVEGTKPYMCLVGPDGYAGLMSLAFYGALFTEEEK